MARPSLFKPEYVEKAREFAAQGALDREMAAAFGVCMSAFYEWKNRYPEFGEAIKLSKEVADRAVETALFRKATGYSHDAVKIQVVDGAVVETPYTEHYPPDATAMIFWLKNRRPETWRDKQSLEIGMDEDLASLIAARRAKASEA